MDKYCLYAESSKATKTRIAFPPNCVKFRAAALGFWSSCLLIAFLCISWHVLTAEATSVHSSDIDQIQSVSSRFHGNGVYAKAEKVTGKILIRQKHGADHTASKKNKRKKHRARKSREKSSHLQSASFEDGFHEARSLEAKHLTSDENAETRFNVTSRDAREAKRRRAADDVGGWKRMPSEAEVERFQKLVLQTMECRNLPALSLTLVKQGHVVLATNLGHADPEARTPVTNETRFAIGSLTKAFTATVVTDFLMEHNISLDLPVRELLHSDFRLMDDQRTRGVSTRDLLGHRTGVPGYFNALLVGLPADVTRSDLLMRLQHLPAAAPLRSQFLYNNYLFTLAAHVVELISGQSWETLVMDRLLSPLGMTSTGFVDKVKDFGLFALPCALVNGSFRNLAPDLLLSVSPCGPAGSLYSTAHDMTQWLRLMLADGKMSDGRQLLKDRVLRETVKAVMPPPGIGSDLTRPVYPVSDVEQSYGMGWITSNYRGYRKIWHSGGIVTYSSRLWLLPGVDAGLFVATNGPQTSHKAHALTAITSLAADLLLGEEPWLNASTVCSFPAPWDAHKVVDSPGTTKTTTADDKGQAAGDDLEELIGTYVHAAFGEIVIERAAPDPDVEEGMARGKNSNTSSESRAEHGNGSTWLTLRFGRFGRLRISKVLEEANTWQGTFFGPLWYVTASDEAFEPVYLTFVHDRDGRVSKLRYPIDGQFDRIEFEKRAFGVSETSSHVTSGSDSFSTFSPVLSMLFLFLHALQGTEVRE